MKTPIVLVAAAALLLPVISAASNAVPELVSRGQLAQSVDLRNVNVDANGNISATIVNHTSRDVRDVKLMVNYAWVWANDFRPGENSPGRTVYITAPADIPPHGTGMFTYRPPEPLTARGDGHFVPSVYIVGFTQMIPAT